MRLTDGSQEHAGLRILDTHFFSDSTYDFVLGRFALSEAHVQS